MGVIRAIKRFYDDRVKRNWDKGYFFIDLHGTVLKPNYTAGKVPTEFYSHAKETLQLLTKMDDVCLIMFTCSHPNEIIEYVNFFSQHGITFNYINLNPEVKTDVNGYGCYDNKPYINVLFDDKAGFSPETEWEEVLTFMKTKLIYIH